MNNSTDQQLLRDYSESRSEPAFAELVRRHVDLVYSAALRMVRDSQLAEDVTQGVFMALAKNAPQLAEHPVLSGWLHRAAQNLAVKIIRTDTRRRAREQEAATMHALLSPEPNTAWEDVAPHLDAALGELNEPDRDALLLRFFEKKSAREMAEILGVSDEAAQKRVTRAVGRLRELFARRGIAVGAGGLAVVITANAVQSAPAALAFTIPSTALAGTTLTNTTITTTAKAIAMTTLQKTLITAALVLVGAIAAVEIKTVRDRNAESRQSISSTPPVMTFLSATTNVISWNQAIVTGGWIIPSGKRVLTITTLQPVDNGRSLDIKSTMLGYPEDTGKTLGLDQFNVDGQTTTTANTMDRNRAAAILKAVQRSNGANILTQPEVTTESGRQARVEVTDNIRTPSGEKYSTGPVIDYIPTISADGQSVRMVIVSTLKEAIQPGAIPAPTN